MTVILAIQRAFSFFSLQKLQELPDICASCVFVLTGVLRCQLYSSHWCKCVCFVPSVSSALVAEEGNRTVRSCGTMRAGSSCRCRRGSAELPSNRDKYQKIIMLFSAVLACIAYYLTVLLFHYSCGCISVFILI